MTSWRRSFPALGIRIASGWLAAAALLAGCASAPPPVRPSSAGAISTGAGDAIAEWLRQRGEAGEEAQRRGPQTPAERGRSDALVVAMAYVGVPYRRGGGDFEQGVDCSGFVQIAFRDGMGVRLPRTAAEQAQATRPIEPDELSPGDLVFFNTLGRPFSHVGIYVGQGRFVHSPRPGSQVRLERMDGSYWRARFDGARRVDGDAPLQARAD